jgi:hypothetical protein
MMHRAPYPQEETHGKPRRDHSSAVYCPIFSPLTQTHERRAPTSFRTGHANYFELIAVIAVESQGCAEVSAVVTHTICGPVGPPSNATIAGRSRASRP